MVISVAKIEFIFMKVVLFCAVVRDEVYFYRLWRGVKEITTLFSYRFLFSFMSALACLFFGHTVEEELL